MLSWNIILLEWFCMVGFGTIFYEIYEYRLKLLNFCVNLVDNSKLRTFAPSIRQNNELKTE